MDKDKDWREISGQREPWDSGSHQLAAEELKQPPRPVDVNKHLDDIRCSPAFPSLSSFRIGRPSIYEHGAFRVQLDAEKNWAGMQSTKGSTRNIEQSTTQAENDLSLVYGHGPLQRSALFIGTLASFVFVAHNVLFSVVATDVDHWCKQPPDYASLTSEEWRNISVPRDASGHWLKCVRYDPPLSVDASNRSQVPCKEWDYDVDDNSIITEWDLVCDRRWLVSLTSAAFMSGSAAAAPVVGNLCDNFGRRQVLHWSVLSLLISGVATCFASTITYFLVLRFIASASVSTVQITSYIILFELATPAYRCLYSVIAVSAPTITAPLLLGVADLIAHDWVLTQVALLLPASLLLSTFSLTVESPLWLLSTKDFKDAELALIQAAQVNGISVSEAHRQWRLHNIRLYCPDGDTFLITKSNWADFLSSSSFRNCVIVIFWCWFFVILGYYNRHGRHTDNIWLLAAEVTFEAFAYVLLYLSMTKLGRRATLEALFVCFSALEGMVATVTMLQPTSDMVLPLGMAVDVITDMAITVLCVYSTELFPTVVRSKGLCAAYFFGGVGGIVAPLLHEVGSVTTTEFVPSLLSLVGIFTALAVHWLPETMSTGVLNILQDVDDPEKKKDRRKSSIWASRLSIASTKSMEQLYETRLLAPND